MVNNLGFGWPKPLCFMVLGAHGRYYFGIFWICLNYFVFFGYLLSYRVPALKIATWLYHIGVRLKFSKITS